MVLSEVTLNDWLGIYGAILSTVLAVIGGLGWVFRKIRASREIGKFKTDLYFLRKIDKTTKEVHPIIVVLLANLGRERISLKSLDYSGISENGAPVSGCMGWYEQPEEAYGIRNRLLPIVLENGQTADLPMVSVGIFTRTKNLKIWLTDFDEKRHYIEDCDIERVRQEITKFNAK